MDDYDDLGGKRKEAAIVYFKIISQNILERTEENY
jgi:hypothetical protein